MAYDDWKTGGSDPGYDPQNDQPEPEQFSEGFAISFDGSDPQQPIAVETFGPLTSADDSEKLGPVATFADVASAARWLGMSVRGTEDCRWFGYWNKRLDESQFPFTPPRFDWSHYQIFYSSSNTEGRDFPMGGRQ